MPFDLLTVLGAGLLTFATPCVLPMIPIYLAALVGGDPRQLARAPRTLLLGRAAWFSAGFIAVFTAMGVGASGLGALLAEHRVAVQLFGAALVLVLGLKLLGIVRLPWLDRTLRADDTRFSSRLGAWQALLMGVVFAAGWSPCVGPVLGSVLTFAASRTTSAWEGALYLGTYGLGLALPLLVLAAFADRGLRLLGRLKRHLPRLERATGAILLAVAALLAYEGYQGLREARAAARPAATKQGEAPASSPAARLGLVGRLPAMVELYSAGCPVCARMKPLVDTLDQQCSERGVAVEPIDLSRPENRALASELRVVGVPTFLFLDSQGNEVARLVGEQPEATLRQALAAVRGEPCPGLGAVQPAPAASQRPGGEPAACDAPTAPAPEHASTAAEPSCGQS